jgi:lipopolysaccharide/colanic/teichoic acid biosynthesis glycosyltransferase
MLTRFLSRLFTGTAFPGAGAQQCRRNFASPQTIRQILARERVRSDRTGDPLALIVFAADDPSPANAACRRLVSLLEQRLRCTDEPGWWTDQEVCVVLPHTSVDGARAFAGDVCTRLPKDQTPLRWTLYAYPLDTNDSVVDVRPASEPHVGSVQSLEALFMTALPRWKRALDIVLSSIGLLVLLPVFAVIMLAIRLTSRGPVFFRQRRSGQGGKPFMLFKFRTMVIDAEARKKDLMAFNEQDGAAFKIKHDPRITRLGRILRTTSLDELPQLWNILRGDMTLVGPRPLPCDETAKCEGWQRRRLEAMPGLTCIWQVRGRGGVPFDDWIRMDLQYIRSRSLFQDLKLLFLTVPAVVLRRGAH